MNQALSSVGSLQVESFALGPFETSAWLIVPPEEPAVVVDPGMDAGPLLEVLQDRGIRVGRILLTHGHLDHVAGCAELVRRYSCPIHLHPADLFLYRSLKEHGALYGFMLESAPEPVVALQDRQRLPLGEGELEVLWTPGHSPGSVCFRINSGLDRILVCGDTIFAGAFGRTDLPGGSFAQLNASIRERIFSLEPDTRLLPGHGPESTVGAEQRENPINHASAEEWL